MLKKSTPLYILYSYSLYHSFIIYSNFIKERYDRCLDLYLAPRTLKRKINIDKNKLLPDLPNIAELRPFPTTQCLEFDCHEGRVRTVRTDLTGYYIASGGDDKKCTVILDNYDIVIITELITGRVMKSIDFPDVIQEVRWNPSTNYSDVIAVACGRCVYFLDLELSGNEEIHQKCQDLLYSKRRVWIDKE